MARVLSTVFVVALLAATAAAFALTEGAKLERSPIFGTSVPRKVFSPDCQCASNEALISFRLRKPQTLTAWMERDGKRVRTLVSSRSYPRGRVVLSFDGRTDSGGALPDGIYRPVVHLASSHRTIALPNPIRLDTKPPTIRVRRVHAVISPDGDGHADSFRAAYSVDEPAHGELFVNGTARGKRVLYTLGQKLHGTLVWNGRIGGKPARPRNYVLYAAARDTAGNESKPMPFAVVQVRYVALGRQRVVVRPGGRFALRVSADAPRVRWILHGRSGTARPGTLRLRAPRSQGVYRLYVVVAGHAATATVVVA